MHLYEEYLARHSITLPVVKHTGQGYLFFKESDDDSWRIASILLTDQKQGPNNYSIKVFKPVRMADAYFGLNPVYEEDDIEWDDYEDFILDWCRVLSNFKIALTESDIFFAAWEMFIVANDEWFSRNFPSDVLYSTLDEDLSRVERLHNIRECACSISLKSPTRYRTWRDEVLNLVDNYAYWLCDIIKNDRVQIQVSETSQL